MTEQTGRLKLSQAINIGIERAEELDIGAPEPRLGKYISQGPRRTSIDALTCLYLGYGGYRNAQYLKSLVDAKALDSAAHTITRELHANMPDLFRRVNNIRELRDAAYKARLSSIIVESMSVYRLISYLNDKGSPAWSIAATLARAGM